GDVLDRRLSRIAVILVVDRGADAGKDAPILQLRVEALSCSGRVVRRSAGRIHLVEEPATDRLAVVRGARLVAELLQVDGLFRVGHAPCARRDHREADEGRELEDPLHLPTVYVRDWPSSRSTCSQKARNAA